MRLKIEFIPCCAQLIHNKIVFETDPAKLAGAVGPNQEQPKMNIKDYDNPFWTAEMEAIGFNTKLQGKQIRGLSILLGSKWNSRHGNTIGS